MTLSFPTSPKNSNPVILSKARFLRSECFRGAKDPLFAFAYFPPSS